MEYLISATDSSGHPVNVEAITVEDLPGGFELPGFLLSLDTRGGCEPRERLVVLAADESLACSEHG